ncbi:PREDICTED: ribonuclease 3-like protein 3 [Camelina sativa]|uniref:Ribonuclease 3-like protein 3 n=1 Tax=Camelina sativa TaxID=90675 RepID=A0ABM0X6X9_CAMSA|nr:PREDICTED: ribonuclease 3-like protein 3 [Camelina sativa]
MDDAVEAVEKILNYSFVNKTLLKAALPQTFPEDCAEESSILNNRLELLGDSVLEVAFTNYIYHAYPNLKLNELRDLRIANVSKEKLARAAVKHNLHRYAIHEKCSTTGEKFIEAVSREGDHVLYNELVKAPKGFANLVESIAGAVYIDVNYDVQRLWEIFRGLLEPIYTPDDLRLQLKPSSLALFRLADEHGKRIDFRYWKDVGRDKHVAEVYLDDRFIAAGRAKNIHIAKVLAAAGVLQKLSDCLPIGNIIDEDNPLTEEMTEEEIVFDEDSPHVEPEDGKGMSFEICSTDNLQLQTELSSFPSTFENPLTDEMEKEQMFIDEDSPHDEPDDAKGKLFEICANNKWPDPIFSVEEESGIKNEQRFVCSVKIEIPTIEGSFHMKGDVKPTKKLAENSSANHMIKALESSMMSLVISNLQMPKSLDENKKNLQMQETSDEHKNLRLKKRRTTYEMTPNEMGTGEDSLGLEPEDVKGQSIEICSTDKLQTQTGSSSFLTASKNPLSDEMTEEQIVMDEDSPHVEPADVKGKSFKICSTKKLQQQTGSSSLPTAAENPSTSDMTTKQMVGDKDSLHVEPEDVKGKLYEICANNNWPNPVFSVEEERGPENEQKFVCSVKIEIPTIEGSFHMKGDVKPTKKLAEVSSADHMIRALESSMMSLVICNLQMPNSLDEKKKNLQIQESLDESKSLHSKKRRTTYEMTPNKMVTCEDSLDVELEDVKGKSTEICSTKKLQTQTGSSSFQTTSGNPLSDDMTDEQIVIDEDSPHVEPEDVKGNSFEIWSTEKLQLQTESSSLSAASENPLTNEKKQEQMVTDKDSSHVEPDNAKGKLFEICDKKKWPRPIFSFEVERGPKNEQKIVCSVQIEIPTIKGTFFIKGDAKSKKKQAENSAAYHMRRAISNLQMPETINKKKKSSLFCSKMDSDSVEAVEKILNYIFKNKDLLTEALSQTSSQFKRLMFVGEAALELAFTNHIYLMYPKFGAREMSLLRIANTRNKNYARVAVKHNIYQFFISKLKLDEKIKVFSEVEGKENGPVPQSAKPPKVVSDLVDSVAGAVFIDMNFDVKRLWEIFRGLFEPLYTLENLRLRPQPLRTLFCMGDKENGNRTTSAHIDLDDEFIARGKNEKTRDAAKMNAAKEALQKLSESMPVEIVMEEDRLDIEIEDAKDKLIEICNKRKWPNPVYSVENYERPGGFVCSAMIETTTEEGTLYAKGDRRRRRETAENSSATHLLRALEYSLKDDL